MFRDRDPYLSEWDPDPDLRDLGPVPVAYPPSFRPVTDRERDPDRDREEDPEARVGTKIVTDPP